MKWTRKKNFKEASDDQNEVKNQLIFQQCEDQKAQK